MMTGDRSRIPFLQLFNFPNSVLLVKIAKMNCKQNYVARKNKLVYSYSGENKEKVVLLYIVDKWNPLLEFSGDRKIPILQSSSPDRQELSSSVVGNQSLLCFPLAQLTQKVGFYIPTENQ